MTEVESPVAHVMFQGGDSGDGFGSHVDGEGVQETDVGGSTPKARRGK
eukprot:CAMPEP_0175816380 /NCGR_PEP_ID=MMETSP0107_2-20121207/6466_1 /TAXON_ID=195067 ORGANISM="Goniomonas pacifica, Strain CCMP1869" /NCGR_SAMPLE_ID=MMETSP0107_2 /ASSEMBLY_ACC=CAM_ASM_000203 /LENGTH=47 /DNA_ID= /DNA_START= /DNA_END= /DNA_ORIENTATION=